MPAMQHASPCNTTLPFLTNSPLAAGARGFTGRRNRRYRRPRANRRPRSHLLPATRLQQPGTPHVHLARLSPGAEPPTAGRPQPCHHRRLAEWRTGCHGNRLAGFLGRIAGRRPLPRRNGTLARAGQSRLRSHMQLLPLSFFHIYFSLPVVVVPQSYNHLQLLQSPLLPVLSVQHYLGI